MTVVSQKQSKPTNRNRNAELFKRCTERFFDAVNADELLRDQPVHFSDIEYQNSYFIFEFYKNSVVHFHVDECPGWKFGIWWKNPERLSEQIVCVRGDFFAQHEEAIDKFKPTASGICREIVMYPDWEENTAYPASLDIRFIRDEPYRAFCRCHLWFELNTAVCTQEEAEKKYREYMTWKNNKKHYTSIVDRKAVEFVEENILPLFHGARIEDEGYGSNPRYGIYAPFKDNTDIVEHPGAYGWFGENDENGKGLISEYNSIIKEGKEYGTQYEFWYESPFSGDIIFYR